MADSTAVEETTDRERLAQAIVAAADLEFSQFKDHITDTVEARFKDRISQIAKEKAAAIFNPDGAPAEEPDEEFEFENVDDLDDDPPQDPSDDPSDDPLDDPLDDLDDPPEDPPADPEPPTDPPEDPPEDPPADPE